MDIQEVKRVRGDWQSIKDYPRMAMAFEKVKEAVGAVFPELRKTRIFIGCPHQKEKHSHHQWKDTDKSGKNWRAFAHTNHFPSTVCFHPHAEKEMETRNLIGMMLHEFGHQINDVVGLPNTQKNADLVILKYLGLKIKYSNPGRIQYIDL